ncbi:MAG TPA: DNA alkylation repair protein [Candidatus Acidoferrales bacterium]|nr:DNA alkylation repair protein [Candidatus Acidoferrales bacterium]
MPPESATLEKARKSLRRHADARKARVHRGFFKETNDVFLGVTTPQIRNLSRQYQELPLRAVEELMKSRVHDERSLAHAILVRKFRAADDRAQTRVFEFYVRNRKHIRSWDGVDDSAPYIVGPYLLSRNKRILHELARSKRLWDRRIAIVATWWFIRQGQTETTLKLARTLLNDDEDLIHKASGWMLREVGKRNLAALKRFLRAYSHRMPRTALRYAIERFPQQERLMWLARKKSVSHRGR